MSKSTRKAPGVKWTLLRASAEFGVTRETIRRGLFTNGVEVKPNRTYSTREIHNAIAGDLKAARAREALANAIARERDNRVADGELIPLADNLAWQERVLLPVRHRLVALPGSLAQRCNPSDPQFAQRALDEWLNETLPLLRTEVAKAEPKK
jgi:hypothetical protein